MQTVQYISMQYDDEGAKNVSEMSPSPLFAAINLVTKATTVTSRTISLVRVKCSRIE